MPSKDVRRFGTVLLLLTLEFVLAQPLVGKTISLNGTWDFVADPSGQLSVNELPSAQNIRPARVPSSWQLDFTDLRDFAGVGWYWRSANLEPPPPDHVVLLRFGAVDYLATVYVNGQKIGSHEGGYLPFEFDITPLVHAGENQIAVRVVDAGGKMEEVEGIRYAEIPHGKQNWYVQTSGLWQDVELDIRPRMHWGVVHVLAGADGNFKIELPIINLVAQTGEPAKVRAQIFDPANKLVWEATQTLKTGQSNYVFTGRLSSPSLWSPQNPALYKLNVWISSGDSQDYGFGFRTFETRGGKFYLNGNPIYLRGALDQDFYPDTGYTPPSLDFIRDEMHKAKSLGLNLLRCHIKAPDPRYLQAADEVGLLVWYEIPNWDKLTENSERRALDTLRGMAERDWNHPSIVIVSIINESWGVNLKEARDRAWLKQAYNEAKRIVPGWLVVDNSPCCENFHLATDIADFHHYSAIPDHAADFDRVVDDQARRPGWLFSPYGDAAPKSDEPLILSEFGNWGLPRVPEAKPWWFARDYGGRELTLPEGAEERFAQYQYGSLFPDFHALTEATQWAEYRALKYEIESLRSHPEIQGYVITEFTDIQWESNGLLDMWRRPKIYAEPLAKLQREELVILRAEKRNFTSGEKVRLDAYFSHYSAQELKNAEITWLLIGAPGISGKLPVAPMPQASGAKAGTIEFTAPPVAVPWRSALKVRLSSSENIVSENSMDLFFYPPRVPELPPTVSFRDPASRLRRLISEMRARNYSPPAGTEALPVMIASVFDDAVKKVLRDGGRVILIPSDRMTLAPGLEILPRAKSRLDGNWISSFHWTRKNQEPFKSIGFETLAGFETAAAAPSAVVQGVPPENFQDVLAGMFYGWIHSNVGTLVQARAGKGKLLICTFSLATTYGTDPYATYLLDALVNYIVSNFTPGFEVPLAAQ